jgi:hypothetical protein
MNNAFFRRFKVSAATFGIERNETNSLITACSFLLMYSRILSVAGDWLKDDVDISRKKMNNLCMDLYLSVYIEDMGFASAIKVKIRQNRAA